MNPLQSLKQRSAKADEKGRKPTDVLISKIDFDEIMKMTGEEILTNIQEAGKNNASVPAISGYKFTGFLLKENQVRIHVENKDSTQKSANDQVAGKSIT